MVFRRSPEHRREERRAPVSSGDRPLVIVLFALSLSLDDQSKRGSAAAEGALVIVRVGDGKEVVVFGVHVENVENKLVGDPRVGAGRAQQVHPGYQVSERLEGGVLGAVHGKAPKLGVKFRLDLDAPGGSGVRAGSSGRAAGHGQASRSLYCTATCKVSRPRGSRHPSVPLLGRRDATGTVQFLGIHPSPL